MVAACAVAGQAFAADVVNLYSARKEALIKPLLDRYTEQTGVRVNLVTGKAGPLLERLKAEGRNSPADLFITVDAGRLYKAKVAGVLQAVKSKVLDAAIPAAYRDPAEEWFGLSLRARPIMVAKGRVDRTRLTTYEGLAEPRWKGRICMRSSSNIYNQSLVASMIAADGKQRTLAWLRGLVANFARPPRGGDRDQIKALAVGECDITLANTYYLARMLRSDDPRQREAASKVEVVWPNQAARGAHVNVSGAGVTRSAPHRAAAMRLLEYLVSDDAQQWYAETNNEYPVKPGVAVSAVVRSFGEFKADTLNLAQLGAHNADAVNLMDIAGWR